MPGRVPFDYIQHLTARNGEYWGINKISCERCQYLVGVIEKVVHNLVVTPTIWAYGHILFHCSLLYCASQILHFFFFLQIECVWQPCIEQVHQHHFSNGICSLCVSASRVGNSYNISDFFIIMMMCGQWSLMLLLQKDHDSLKTQMMISIFGQ